MEIKKLTIGIPTYNRDKYLNELLESIFLEMNSIEFPIEIIISDNCSIDSTSIIVSNWENKLPIKYSKNDENLGMDANIDVIFRKASSEYVLLVSDDDLLIRGILKYYYDLILEENPSIVYSKAMFKSHDLSNKELFTDKALANFKESKIYKFKNGAEFYKFTEKFYCGLTGVMMKREDFLESNRELFKGSIFIQAGVAMEIMSKKNAPVFFINKELWIYRLGKTSSRIKNQNQISEIGFGLLDLLNKVKHLYPNKIWQKIYMKELNWVRSLLIGIKSREGISLNIKRSYIEIIDSERNYKIIDSVILNAPDFFFKISYKIYRLIRYGNLEY